MRAFAHLIAPQDVWVTIACETLQCRGIKVLLKIALVATSYSDLPRVGKINNIKKSFWILGIWYAILYIYSFSTNVWSLWQVHCKFALVIAGFWCSRTYYQEQFCVLNFTIYFEIASHCKVRFLIGLCLFQFVISV